MTLSQAVPVVVGEIADSIELAPHRNGFYLEPRCRVCRNDQVRKKVNDLLATGASYAFIVRALAADNDKLDPRDTVTVDSVRNHCTRHFPVQNVARAVYREIVERRAKENQVDFVEGVVTAITPIAFFEVAMNKAFQTLVDDRTEVSIETGLRAAEKLQSVLDGRERGTDVLELKVALDQISQAVRAVVPQSMWAEIIEALEQHSEALDVGEDGFDDADDDPYDPRPSSSTRTTSFDLRSPPSPRAMGTAAGVDGAFAVAWILVDGTGPSGKRDAVLSTEGGAARRAEFSSKWRTRFSHLRGGSQNYTVVQEFLSRRRPRRSVASLGHADANLIYGSVQRSYKQHDG